MKNESIKKIIFLVTILGQASIALYLPALPQISHELIITDLQVKYTITCFIIGFGLSPMILGPLSDVLGRKPILLFSLGLAFIGFIGNSLSSNFELFIIFRFLQGLGCGGLLTSGRSVARDTFSGKELASASSYLSMGFAIGFGLSPLVGGILLDFKSWPIIFLFLSCFDIILFIIVLMFLPETKENNIDNKHFFKNTLTDYYSALTNSRFVISVLSGLFSYCIVITYNVMTPFLVQNEFGYTPQAYGYLAVFIGVPYFTGALLNRNIVMKKGVFFSCVIGSVMMLAAGAALYSLAIFRNDNIYSLIIPFMIATFGQALVFSNTIANALQLFPASSGGRISALYSSLQMILVSIVSIYLGKLNDKSLNDIALVVLTLGILTFIFVILAEKMERCNNI